MRRYIPPEVDKVKNWCLMNKRFDDVQFILTIKQHMEQGQTVSFEYAQRLKDILRTYHLNHDLREKINQRSKWR